MATFGLMGSSSSSPLLPPQQRHYQQHHQQLSGVWAEREREREGERERERFQVAPQHSICRWVARSSSAATDRGKSRKDHMLANVLPRFSSKHRISFLQNDPSLPPTLNNQRGHRSISRSVSVASPPELSSSQSRTSISSLMEPVAEDLQILNRNLRTVIGSENPLLMAASEQIFSAGGKRMRPALVLLTSRATAQLAGLDDLTPQHRRLAEVIEMIHTASLIHDDVLDESNVRRGKKAVHQLYGTRVAVLAGDFMFAQSSWYLAKLGNLEVIKLISQVIKDLAEGEIRQAACLFDCDMTLQDYLDKSYYKTASLIAASTLSAAIFSGVSTEICDSMYNYGMNLGLAFQVVDDILDFTRSSEQLGKPAGSDLSKGNLTAPVLFSLEGDPKLRKLIDSEFSEENDLETAVELVRQGGGFMKAHALAREKGEMAKSTLVCLPPGPLKSCLEGMVDYVLERLF